MKKIFAALMTMGLLLCLCAGALGAGIEKVPAERLLPNLVPGLVEKGTQKPGENWNVEVKRKDGEIDLLIHADRVNWQEVLLYAYNARSGYVSLYPGIENPKTVDGKAVCYFMGFGTNAGTPDSQVLDILANDEQLADGEYNDAGESFFNGWDFGRYQEKEKLFVPEDCMDGGLVCRWYDGDGQVLLTERAKVTIRMTGSDRVMDVALNNVPRSRIVPRPDAGIADDLTITLEDGAARVETADAEKLDTDKVQFLIALPEELAGIENPGCRWWQDSFDGKKEYNRIRKNGGVLLEPQFTGVEPYTLEWYDKGSGETKRVERVVFTMVSMNGVPWPGHKYEGYPELTPVDGKRLSINGMPRGQISARYGVDVTYGEMGEGILHYAPGERLLEHSREIGKLRFTYTVGRPSDGALYYSESHSSAGNIFGSMEHFMAEQDLYLRDVKARRAVSAGGMAECRSGYTPVEEYKGQGGTRVFLPGEMATEFAGGVMMIYWYDSMDEDAEPIAAEYFVERQDPFVISRHESELSRLPTGRLSLPRLHIKGLRDGHPYVLWIDYYPQESENSFYYEIYLTDDETGERISLSELKQRENIKDEWLELYLPYIEGFEPESGVQYTVRHYLDGGAYDEYVSGGEPGGNFSLETTAQGLRMRVKSLSPFEVSAQESAAADTTAAGSLPQTGDPSMLGAWLALLSASAVGLNMRRKK